MALSKETEKWLEGLEKEGKLPKETVDALRTQAASSSDLDNFVKGSVLRQDDYSRNIAEVKKAQETVEATQKVLKDKEEALTKFQGELGTWKADAETNYNKALGEREAAERKAAAAVAKLKNLALSNGLSEDDVLKDLDVAPKVEEKNPTFDTSKFLTKEEAQKFTADAAYLDATIYDIGEQHKEIFGTSLKNAKEIVAEAIKKNKKIEDVWREKYDVFKKLDEKREADVQARIDAAVKEKETALRSSLQLPAPRASREDSPYSTHQIFDNEKIQQGVKDAGVGQTSEGVSAAIAAFNQGKYTQKFGR